MRKRRAYVCVCVCMLRRRRWAMGVMQPTHCWHTVHSWPTTQHTQACATLLPHAHTNMWPHMHVPAPPLPPPLLTSPACAPQWPSGGGQWSPPPSAPPAWPAIQSTGPGSSLQSNAHGQGHGDPPHTHSMVPTSALGLHGDNIVFDKKPYQQGSARIRTGR